MRNGSSVSIWLFKQLDNDDTIAAYLSAAQDDDDPNMFLIAIKDVARARGMTQLAKDIGLGRESLYKALAPGAKEHLEADRTERVPMQEREVTIGSRAA